MKCTVGELSPPRYDCVPRNCTAHFELPWAMPPLPGYNRSVGINSPIVEWVPPEARTCLEGPSIADKGRCTANCLPGYEPNIPFLSCSLSNFSPPIYECIGQPCQAVKDVDDSPPVTCAEGALLDHGGSCTTLCDFGFLPSESVLSCNATFLDPPNYTCIGMPCVAPTGIANAADDACLEPAENLTHGGVCTAQCLPGFVPSPAVLYCYGGQLRPIAFECIEESVWSGYQPSDGTIAAAWSNNVASSMLHDGTVLACFKDELSLAMHCVVVLASVAAVRQGQWNTLTAPEVEQFVLRPLGTDKAICCYRLIGGSTFCRPMELVSESLDQGLEVLLSAADTYHLALASVADDRAAVCFQQGLDSWRCRLLDVDSNDITMQTELVIPGTLSGLAITSLGSSHLVACTAVSTEGRATFCHLLQISGSSLSNISSIQVSAEATFLTAASDASLERVLICFSDWASASAVCKLLAASGGMLVEVANLTVDTGITRYLAASAVSDGRALLCFERQGPLQDQCADHRLQCEQWAADGECSINPKYMNMWCQASCRVCSQVGRSQGRCHVIGLSGDAVNMGEEAVVNDGITWNFAISRLEADSAVVCFSDSTQRDAARCRVVWGMRSWEPLIARACSENATGCVP